MASKWRKAKFVLGLNRLYKVPSMIDHDSAPLSQSYSGASSLLSQRALAEEDNSSLTFHTSTAPPPPPALSRNRQLSESTITSSSEKTCSICLASLEPEEGHAIFTAECSHSFHFHCLTTNVNHGNHICPICRTNWKEIPLQSPIHPGDVGLVPALVGLPHSNALMSITHRVPPHSSGHAFQFNEPAVFHDDECLSPPDRDKRSTANASVASSSAVKTIDIITYPEVSSIQRIKSLNNFTVLIHLKAATNNVLRDSGRNEDMPFVSQPSRTQVDLVTVLDISGSMSGSKLALLKRAMGFVIQNLSSDDRLSVIAFSSTARRLFPLLRMTINGRQRALIAVNSLKAGGGTNIAEGLRKGAKVMEERRVKNPVASIILLSDGRDTYTRYAEISSGENENNLNYELLLPLSFLGNDRSGPRIPVHTFGFGTDHDASLLHSISEMSGGTFSFIETEATVQDAFAQCIGGLLSVVVQELQVGVECVHPGTCLVTLKAGSYPTRITSDGRSGYVDVGDIYAEEERDFLVSLNIPSETSGNSTSLLKVRCVYKNPFTKEIATLEGGEVKIQRPDIVEEGEEVISIEVDRQRNRLLAAEAMRQARIAAEAGDLNSAISVLENFRQILASTESAKSHDQLCIALDVELKEMQERLASRHVYESSGRAYILSGLSSHSSQRAAARGDSSYSLSDDQSYQTPSMTEMLRRSRAMPSGSPADQSWSFPSPKPR